MKFLAITIFALLLAGCQPAPSASPTSGGTFDEPGFSAMCKDHPGTGTCKVQK